MSQHGQTDDGAQASGKFSVMDTPMNVTTEGGAAPKGDNMVPTAEFPDPLGLMPGGRGAKSIGPKG
jgi:hypothetical protein